MNYKVTITTLTPLHIGNGQELLDLYDLKQDRQKGQTYRLNVDAILEDAISEENPQLNQQILQQKPAELVSLAELRQRPEFSVYTLKGTPRSGQVKEQIKNSWGQLYLPGSSLKGALRTVIGRAIGGADGLKNNLKVNYRFNKPKAKFADDEMERAIFGDDPNSRSSFRSANYDLLRALQVADSRPVDANPQLINVSVIKGGQPQAPIDVEAIPRGVSFETTIRLDEYLYKEQHKVIKQKDGGWATPVDRLGWQENQIKWLYNLPIAARNAARERFEQEIAYFKAANLTRLVQIYTVWNNTLASMRGSQIFYLQLGWGGGWENKTFGEALIAKNKNRFAKIRKDFNLGKPPGFKGKWNPGPNDVFPASRRLRVNAQDKPLDPLGWVEVTLERVKQK